MSSDEEFPPGFTLGAAHERRLEQENTTLRERIAELGRQHDAACEDAATALEGFICSRAYVPVVQLTRMNGDGKARRILEALRAANALCERRTPMSSQTLTPPPTCPEGWPPGYKSQGNYDDPRISGGREFWRSGKIGPFFKTKEDSRADAWEHYRTTREYQLEQRVAELEAENERLNRRAANEASRVAKISRIEELVAEHGPCSEAPDDPDEPQVCGDDLCAWCAVVMVIDDITPPPVDDRTSEHG